VRFARHHDVTGGGNFEGHNILNVPRPEEAEHAALAPARARLYEVRKQRIPPLRDEKILAAWNGLMISALAVGGRVLNEPRYVAAAARAAGFLMDRLRQGDRLCRSYKDGRKQAHGFLEDQAFAAAGLLDLFEATFDPRWLKEAIGLSDALEKHFADRAHGGWFMTADDAEKLIAREKPMYDGAEPSGTSVAVLNALRLHTFTNDERWRAVAEEAFSSMHDVLTERTLALTEALVALDYHASVPKEVAVVWDGGGAPEALLSVLRTTFLPSRALAGAAEGPALEALARLVPFVSQKVAQGGKPTGYVCRRGHCELPATDAGVFKAQLLK
jgi:uncharacterized protein